MKINITGLQETFELLDDVITKYPYETIVEVTDDIYENAKTNILPHWISGRMANNLDMRVNRSDLSGEVFIHDKGMMKEWKGKKVNYALFVHFGSKPHVILPKKKKALRWAGLGAFVFAGRVNHSGYKGDPFMTNASQETFKNLDKIFTRVYNGL